MIALLTGVVPNLARLVMSPVWGWLFDRMNFFVMRMTLNLGFAIGIVSFFASDTTTGFVLAAITFGISTAGGDVAWTLWVTKVAPPERVADYMSVHTFFTGVRGLIAPLVGFALVAHWPMTTMGWFSAASIVVGSLFLLPDALKGGPVRKGPVAPRGGRGGGNWGTVGLHAAEASDLFPDRDRRQQPEEHGRPHERREPVGPDANRRGQAAAVDHDEQARVDEHHQPAHRRGDDEQHDRLRRADEQNRRRRWRRDPRRARSRAGSRRPSSASGTST